MRSGTWWEKSRVPKQGMKTSRWGKALKMFILANTPGLPGLAEVALTFSIDARISII